MILTTPAARSAVAAQLFLIAQPPLLYEEGNSSIHRFVLKSLKQFQDRFSSVSGCRWYVLETAAERIIVPNGRVVDSHCRVNGRCDVLRIDGALFGPSGIFDVRTVGCSFAEDSSTTDTAARNNRGVDEVVIASLLCGDVSDRSAELAFDYDQRVVEQRPSVAARYQRKIRHQICQTGVELARRRINSSVVRVNVLVVVPSAEGDLDV